MTIYNGKLAVVPTERTIEFNNRAWTVESADDVLVEIHVSVLCGSDYHIFKGEHPSAPLPMWLGHEASGLVVAVGDSVSKVKIGDRVTIEPNIICGKCPACLADEYNLCEKLTFAYRIGDGAMADYILVKERMVHILPDSLTLKEGALIEPLSVAVHANKQAGVKQGDRVLVIGGGPIGILIAGVAKSLGSAEVIVSDSNRYRQKMALEFGADVVVDRGATDISMVDVCFDCVGAEESINQSIESVMPGGTVCLVGLIDGAKLLRLTRVISAELHIIGTQGYCNDFPTALQLAKEMNIARLITHEFSLESLEEALETGLNRSTKSVKVAIIK